MIVMEKSPLIPQKTPKIPAVSKTANYDKAVMANTSEKPVTTNHPANTVVNDEVLMAAILLGAI